MLKRKPCSMSTLPDELIHAEQNTDNYEYKAIMGWACAR
jgi:hypothetical protein